MKKKKILALKCTKNICSSEARKIINAARKEKKPSLSKNNQKWQTKAGTEIQGSHSETTTTCAKVCWRYQIKIRTRHWKYQKQPNLNSSLIRDFHTNHPETQRKGSQADTKWIYNPFIITFHRRTVTEKDPNKKTVKETRITKTKSSK